MFAKNRITRMVLMLCAAMLLTAGTGCNVKKMIAELTGIGGVEQIEPAKAL